MASLPCEFCGSSDAVEEYEDGKFCFSCHKQFNRSRLKLTDNTKKQKKPKNIQLIPITDFWINWLKSKGINDETINTFNLLYDELSQSIAYPIKTQDKIAGYQLRDINKKIKTVKYVDDDSPFLFSAEMADSMVIVVVEDAVSAMRVWQETGLNAVALMGTNLSTPNKLYLLNKYKRIVIWLDGDLPGYKAAIKIRNDLDGFCETRLIYSSSDPKDLKGHEIRAFFGKVLGITK